MPDLTTRKLNETDGFTLLEMLVAVSIIAIAFVAVFRMHAQTLSMAAMVRFDTNAPMLAREILSGWEKDAEETSLGTSGDFGDRFPGYKWQITTDDISSEALGDTGDLKKVEVLITLDANQSFRLQTYRIAVN